MYLSNKVYRYTFIYSIYIYIYIHILFILVCVHVPGPHPCGIRLMTSTGDFTASLFQIYFHIPSLKLTNSSPLKIGRLSQKERKQVVSQASIFSCSKKVKVLNPAPHFCGKTRKSRSAWQLCSSRCVFACQWLSGWVVIFDFNHPSIKV